MDGGVVFPVTPLQLDLQLLYHSITGMWMLESSLYFEMYFAL
jgi:hypothetical protein